MRYFHVQYSATQGEIGTTLSGQNNQKAFHYGLGKARNVDINYAGNVSIRGGFRWSLDTTTPLELNLGVGNNLGVAEFAFNNPPDGLQYRLLIFGENVAYVFAGNNETKELTYKCTFNTGVSAENISSCCYTIFNSDQSGLGRGLLFTCNKFKPFTITWKNNADQPEDFIKAEALIRNIPSYKYKIWTKTGTQLNTGNITITSQNSVYVIEATNNAFVNTIDGQAVTYPGKEIQINPEGRFRILRKLDEKKLQCTLVGNLGQTQNIPQDDLELELGWEPVVSDDRGWFDYCLWYEGRLFFAGTKQAPGVIAGSTIDDIFDLSLGVGEADDGLYSIIPLESSDRITAIAGGNGLHVMSANSIFIATGEGQGLTPTNFIFKEISGSSGCDPYTEPRQTSEGGIVCIDSKHNQLTYVSFDRNIESYKPITMNGMLTEDMVNQNESITYSFVIVNSGGNKGQNIYYINQSSQIMKAFLSLEDSGLPTFTRYDSPLTGLFPIKLFRFMNELYGVFYESNTNSYSILRLHENSLLDYAYDLVLDAGGNGTLPKYYPALGISEQTKPFMVYDKATGLSYTCSVIEGLSGARSVYIPELAGKAVQVGVPFYVLVETMEQIGLPDNVPSVPYERRCASFYIYAKEISDLWLSIKESKIGAQDKWYHYVDTPYTQPQTEVEPIKSLNGWYKKPKISMKTTKPCKFAYYKTIAEVVIGRS